MKEYKFDNPLITEVDSIIDKGFRDCLKSYFHKFKYYCICDNKLTNITDNELFNLTISVKSMNLYELKRKLKNARQNEFIFNQINKLTIKICSLLQ